LARFSGIPKLIIWDLKNNCSIRKYYFPDDVLQHNGSFANDIVLDETLGFAYISNTWGLGGVIIYDFNRNTSRLFGHDPSLLGNASNLITINNRSFNIYQPTDGIALSSDGYTLYYSSLSMQLLYSVPTLVLQDFSLPDEKIGEFVVLEGKKGYSDGMTFSNNNTLYYGDNAFSRVKFWNSNLSLNTSMTLVEDSLLMQWPDTFAWDTSGHLYFVSNKLPLFLFGGMKFDGSDGANFRIWRVFVNEKSYLSELPIPPWLPCEP